MNRWTPKTTLIVAGVAVVGLWYLKGRAGEALHAVNPMNQDNVINQGAQSVWDVFTDGEGTIGTDIYDWQQEVNEKYYRYTPLALVDRVKTWWSDE